jgi:hypothetical protein
MQKLTLTSPTSGCRSAGIVRSRTQATELLLLLLLVVVVVVFILLNILHTIELNCVGKYPE